MSTSTLQKASNVLVSLVSLSAPGVLPPSPPSLRMAIRPTHDSGPSSSGKTHFVATIDGGLGDSGIMVKLSVLRKAGVTDAEISDALRRALPADGAAATSCVAGTFRGHGYHVRGAATNAEPVLYVDIDGEGLAAAASTATPSTTLDRHAPWSSTGKTRLLASSAGINSFCDGKLMLSLNVMYNPTKACVALEPLRSLLQEQPPQPQPTTCAAPLPPPASAVCKAEALVASVLAAAPVPAPSPVPSADQLTAFKKSVHDFFSAQDVESTQRRVATVLAARVSAVAATESGGGGGAAPSNLLATLSSVKEKHVFAWTMAATINEAAAAFHLQQLVSADASPASVVPHPLLLTAGGGGQTLEGTFTALLPTAVVDAHRALIRAAIIVVMERAHTTGSISTGDQHSGASPTARGAKRARSPAASS